MLTYELALELGIRSPELVERAKEIGIVGIGPSTNLNGEQIARLRQEITGMTAPPPPPVAPLGGPGGFGAGRGYPPPQAPMTTATMPSANPRRDRFRRVRNDIGNP